MIQRGRTRNDQFSITKMNYYSRYRRELEVQAIEKARKKYAASHRVMAEIDKFIEEFKNTHEDFGLTRFKHYNTQHYNYKKHIIEFVKLVRSIQKKEDLMPVSFKQFTEMIIEYNLMIKEELYADKEVDFPSNMGWAFIGKGKIDYDHLRIDWKNTMKYGKNVYHMYDETDGYWFGFRWEKPKGCKYLNLKLMDHNKSELARKINDGLRFSRNYDMYTRASKDRFLSR